MLSDVEQCAHRAASHRTLAWACMLRVKKARLFVSVTLPGFQNVVIHPGRHDVRVFMTLLNKRLLR